MFPHRTPTGGTLYPVTPTVRAATAALVIT